MPNRTKTAKPALVVALDNCTPIEAGVLAAQLSDVGVNWVKVGLELFTQAGPDIVREFKSKKMNVFLDLKLHDIPNTVAQAVKAASATGADLLTVHASGGPVMLEAAQKACAGTSLKLLAVTVLTSLGGEEFESVSGAWGAAHAHTVPRGAVALKLAELAAAAGLPGIVCSVSDLRDGEFRRLSWARTPLFITPGIRNAGDATGDQKSVATVEQAVMAGSTHLVVGRPITGQTGEARAAAARRFLKQIEEA